LIWKAAWGQTVGWRGDDTACFPAAEPPAEWDIDEGTNILWQTKVGRGHSSPVVADKRVFVTAEPDVLVSLGGLLALDPASGEILWESTEAKPAYGTSAAIRIAGEDMVITSRGDCVRVADGKLVATGLGELEYASPIAHGDIVCFVGETTVAWKLANESDGDFRPLKLWESEELEGEFYASPVLHDGVLFTASNEGTLYALDARTGELLYERGLEIRSASGLPGMEPANLYGSPIIAGKHVLLTNDVGEAIVLLPGRQYRECSYNYLDTGSAASPVAAGKRLFLRGRQSFYCISEK
jgi:outer membrane protein assembly factor BamB